MLDFGLGEILLLGATALIVLGPEKLPHAARMAGAWYGKIRRTLTSIHAEIAQEVDLAEMKKSIAVELEIVKANAGLYEKNLKDFHRSVLEENKNNMLPLEDHTHDLETTMISPSDKPLFFYVPASQARALITSAPLLMLKKPPHSEFTSK